jgi:hypothetical protein
MHSQTCIKRSSLGRGQSDFIRVKTGEIFYDSTRKGDL